jgi:hypothetical protein
VLVKLDGEFANMPDAFMGPLLGVKRTHC